MVHKRYYLHGNYHLSIKASINAIYVRQSGARGYCFG